MSKISTAASPAAPQWSPTAAPGVPATNNGPDFFQSVLENLPVAAAVCDSNARLIAVNRAWTADDTTARLFGVALGIGDSLATDVQASCWPELNTALRLILDGSDQPRRLNVGHLGGIYGQLRLAAQPLDDGRGALLTWIDGDMGADDQQGFARAVIESTADYLFVLDRNGRIRYQNRPLEGRLVGQCVGQPFLNFLGPDSRARAKQALEVALRDGERTVFEDRQGSATDGSIFESRVAPLVRDGKVVGVVVNTSDVTVRHQAQTHALELKQRYENLFNTMPVMLSAIDGEGRITDVNGHWLDKLGYGADEVIGHHGSDFLTPQSQQIVNSALGDALSADKTEDIALQLRHKAGDLLDVLAATSFERDSNGAVTRVLSRMIDITASNRAETALRQSEARFQRAVHGTSDGLWDWDLESGLVWYAPRFKELLGYAPDEFADNFVSVREALHPDDRGSTLAAISQHLDGNQALDTECRLRTKTGTYKWFRFRGLAYMGDDATPQRMAGSIQDITVQKHADQALRDNRNFYELILDSVPEHIAYVDAKLRVKFMNRSCERVFGVTDYQAVGGRLDELVGEVRYARMAKAIEAVLEPRPVRVNVNWPVNDKELVLDLELLPHRSRQGRVLGFFWVGRDMTSDNQLEAKLRQAQKMEAIGQLTGGIAHDFNNILSVVLGNLQLLERRLKDTPGMLTKVQTAKRAAVRGGELTQRLLAFARQQVLAPKIVDLNVLVNGMADLLRRSLGDAVQIDLCLKAAHSIEVDPGQAENALLNLAINARDAMVDGGELSIVTQDAEVDASLAEQHPELAPGAYVLLSVTDTGSGIPEDLLAQVVEPFFTTKEVGKGSGLGLSMVEGFVTQSGGYVDISSEVGKGTSIQLYFPRSSKVGSGVVNREPIGDPLALPGGSETILVVEDDQDVRGTAVAMLQELGYRIVEADSAIQALELLGAGEKIDLLFTDIMMPGMRGTQLAQRARQLQADLRVVYASGFTATGVLDREALKSGAELLGKPYTAEALATTVRELLDQEICVQ